ncbi:dipeptidase [Gimesia aquarii]|uniref:Succinyl-diaminopimelate desuccinylase n=1 Tax=Gimesia aquarii TaxID=2527964 RepID=A0A517WQM2_9PLAN|nr:dipeptidase [Gimesia aquarii]QDU07553.1 Succinyl-diaminopimelate desuccinylase [Gimesia aquarii]
MVEQVRSYLEQHQDRFVKELTEFLKIPSVSADSTLNSETRRGAEFVLKQLEDAGIESQIIETAGHPIVYGAWKKAEGKPTVLVYGHYDVQPPDPLDQWITPPFEPDIRDGHIYARGATDDKGQMYTHIKSVEAWMKTHGELPVNVIFVIEGEEEVGSDNLDRFLEENKDLVASDIAVISDTSQYAPGIPAITYGLRGILACEVIVQGPSQDLHSGVFGGAVMNPGNGLAKMIAALHDDEGRVRIPGFYDGVIELQPEERAQFAALPFDEAKFMSDLGVNAVSGEADFSTLERRWARPTCDVNGMISGYTGEGPKTIVPAESRVKISCRLVPGQDPVALTKALEQYLRAQLPTGLTMEFVDFHGCNALVFDFNSPYMSAAKTAIEQSFGAAPVMIREGGSIPVVETFQTVVGVETLLLGWGQNTDNLHSPNERFALEAFRQGTLASALLWHELAGVTV